MNESNRWIIIGAIFTGLGVAFGAFGAHVLEQLVSVDDLETFETGVRYQMYHGLALLFIGLLISTNKNLRITAWAFTLGIIIFSGSLYLLVLLDIRWLGAITPVGGLSFIFGWLFLIYTLYKS